MCRNYFVVLFRIKKCILCRLLNPFFMYPCLMWYWSFTFVMIIFLVENGRWGKISSSLHLQSTITAWPCKLHRKSDMYNIHRNHDYRTSWFNSPTMDKSCQDIRRIIHNIHFPYRDFSNNDDPSDNTLAVVTKAYELFRETYPYSVYIISYMFINSQRS